MLERASFSATRAAGEITFAIPPPSPSLVRPTPGITCEAPMPVTYAVPRQVSSPCWAASSLSLWARTRMQHTSSPSLLDMPLPVNQTPRVQFGKKDSGHHCGVGIHYGPCLIVISGLKGGRATGIVREWARRLKRTLDVEAQDVSSVILQRLLRDRFTRKPSWSRPIDDEVGGLLACGLRLRARRAYLVSGRAKTK